MTLARRLILSALVAILTVAAPLPGYSQAVSLTGAARIKLTLNCEANTKRCTGDITVEPNVAPVFDTLPATIEFTQNQVASYNTAQYCSDPNDDSLTFDKSAGTLPTGLSYSAAGLFTGTPTVVETQAVTLRCGDSTLTDSANTSLVVSAPPFVPDTTPDQFSFTPQTGVTQSFPITSDAAVITGINSTTTVTVANGSWDKNASGIFTGNAGTVVAGDSVRVHHTSSAALNGSTQTTLTIGGVAGVFTSITVSNPTRVGVIYRLNFDALSGVARNPEQSFFPNTDSTTDGVDIRHICEAQWGPPATPLRPASVCDTEGHLEIIDSNPQPINGAFAARGTIYLLDTFPTAIYKSGGFQTKDKPRVDLRMSNSLANTITNTDGPGLQYRKTYWMSVSKFIYSDYQEHCESGWRETQIQWHKQPAVITSDNNAQLMLIGKSGGGGGTMWRLELDKAPIGGNVSSSFKTFDVDLTDDMKNHYNIWTFQFNIDNRTVAGGGSPIMKAALDVCPNGVTSISQCTRQIVANDTTTPWGFDASSEADVWLPAWNTPYPGSVRGDTQGPYTDCKTGSIRFAVDAIRVGDSTSDFASVHPLQAGPPPGW